MNRFSLPLIILAAGATAFCWSRQIVAGIQSDLSYRHSEVLARTAELAHADADKSALQARNRQLKLQLAGAPSGSFNPTGMRLTVPSGALSAEESEQLLAALDFSWNSSSNYIVVSKNTLSNISLRAVNDGKLTAAALGVLAIAPQEQSQLEDLMSRLQGQYDSWLSTHVRKLPPNTNKVLRYELPPDPEFFSSISNAFVSGAADILGPERGNLLLDFSTGWMHDHGMTISMPATFDVAIVSTFVADRMGNVAHDYQYEATEIVNLYQVNTNFSSRLIRPKEAIPAFIQPLFPGGWAEVAQREGFALSQHYFPATNATK